jgi:hypothetical protein
MPHPRSWCRQDHEHDHALNLLTLGKLLEQLQLISVLGDDAFDGDARYVAAFSQASALGRSYR